MIRIKPCVIFKTLRPEIYGLFELIDDTFADRGLDCWITSAQDGKHMAGSKHYDGLAIDLRSKNLPSKAEKKRVLEELKDGMTEQYDVILENEGKPQEHIHVEFDPEV